MQYSITSHASHKRRHQGRSLMNVLNRHYTALLPVAFSMSLLIYFLAYTARVPIRMTVTAPHLEIKVEIYPDKLPSRSNLQQDVTDMLITFDAEKINTTTSRRLN